jgi:hypothetical protein
MNLSVKPVYSQEPSRFNAEGPFFVSCPRFTSSPFPGDLLMPLKVNIGLAKKLGQPNYGSTGASCSLEFELDSGQLSHNPDEFRQNLRNAYDACRQAIQDELHRQLNPPDLQQAKMNGEKEPHMEDQSQGPAVTESAIMPAPAPVASNSTTKTPATCGLVQTSPRASQRQVNYIHHLAHGISGLTPHRLEILSATVCGKRLAHLTSADASLLIETLKDILAGDKDLCGGPPVVCA